MAGGVTTTEFMALMRSHASSTSKAPQVEDTHEFLNRCCDLGLLTRETVEGKTRYFATQALAVLERDE